MASSAAVMLTGSRQKSGRFGTAIAALGDINLDHYNGASVFLYLYRYLITLELNFPLKKCRKNSLTTCYFAP